MHITINGSELGRQLGGSESYLRGLLQGLSSLPSAARVTLLLNTKGIDVARAIEPCNADLVDLGAYRRMAFFLWQQSKALRKVQPDWYVSTFLLPPTVPCRAAVLVHDLSFRARPDWFPASIGLYMRVLTGSAIRHADRVIALSNSTLNEIRRFYPHAVSKTDVVYPGIETEFRENNDGNDDAIMKCYGLTPGYILALGNIHPRKNLARLLDAYVLLQERGGSVPPMVWGGLERWDSTELVSRARGRGITLPGYIENGHLPAVYRNASMLVYPSLYEGFGLPPLEAMACGTPVVTGNMTSLPEVVAEAGLMVDPRDPSAMADAMARLLQDVGLTRRLRAAGLERARQFSWTATAQAVLNSLSAC